MPLARFFCSRSSSSVVAADSAAAFLVGNVFAAGAKPAMRTVAVKEVAPCWLLYFQKVAMTHRLLNAVERYA
jgi:hypothetical protein